MRHCATNRKVAGSIPDGVMGIFLLTQSFRPHYDPGVYSAFNRNEYIYLLLPWIRGIESVLLNLDK
jgi:hypothetical protein